MWPRNEETETRCYLKKYNEGFNDGIKHAAKTIALNFEGIENIPGIGPKTAEKIREHVLNNTFNKKEQNK